MAKAVFKAREFTVKAKGSKEFVSEEMVRAKLFAARKRKKRNLCLYLLRLLNRKKWYRRTDNTNKSGGEWRGV